MRLEAVKSRLWLILWIVAACRSPERSREISLVNADQAPCRFEFLEAHDRRSFACLAKSTTYQERMSKLFSQFSPSWFRGVRPSEADEARRLYCYEVGCALQIECDYAPDHLSIPATETLRALDEEAAKRVSSMGGDSRRLDVLRSDAAARLTARLRNEGGDLGQAVLFKRLTPAQAYPSTQDLLIRIELARQTVLGLKELQVKEPLLNDLASARLDAEFAARGGGTASHELMELFRIADKSPQAATDGGS